LRSLQKLYIDVVYFLDVPLVLQVVEVSFKSFQSFVSDFEPEDRQGTRLSESSQPLLEVWEEQPRYRRDVSLPQESVLAQMLATVQTQTHVQVLECVDAADCAEHRAQSTELCVETGSHCGCWGDRYILEPLFKV
jgi:hypothetical protein